jgi:hypothetical protein
VLTENENKFIEEVLRNGYSKLQKLKTFGEFPNKCSYVEQSKSISNFGSRNLESLITNLPK